MTLNIVLTYSMWYKLILLNIILLINFIKCPIMHILEDVVVMVCLLKALVQYS